MQIYFKKYFEESNCPAFIDRGENDCIIYLNEYLTNKYDKTQWHFWILHEIGHFFLNTNDECKADAFALINIFNKEPYSLKKSLLAIYKLNLNNNRFLKLLEIAEYLDNNF